MVSGTIFSHPNCFSPWANQLYYLWHGPFSTNQSWGNPFFHGGKQWLSSPSTSGTKQSSQQGNQTPHSLSLCLLTPFTDFLLLQIPIANHGHFTLLLFCLTVCSTLGISQRQFLSHTCPCEIRRYDIHDWHNIISRVYDYFKFCIIKLLFVLQNIFAL